MKDILIRNFLRISKIPRSSGHEKKISDFLVQIAKENHLDFFQDEYHNVLIKKKGNMSSPSVALQAHLDMVCVKSNYSNHDFNQDGIEVIINEDKVTAKDTSLGADQGVGLAMMLTLLEDKNLKHPDLEFLFTVEEETTFQGAVKFPYDRVDSKRMINLDHSRDDSVFVGSDGDICNEYLFKGTFIHNNMPSYKVLLDGYPGGNSSEDISLSQNNAIVEMAKILKDKNIFLRSIHGGTSENDLAMSCEVVLNTDLDIEYLFKGTNAKITNFSNTQTFSKEDTNHILNEILNLPCGFISKDMASANLGFIETIQNEVKILYVFRSMSEETLRMIDQKTRNLDYGFQVAFVYQDPIWNVNLNSILMKKYRKLYFQEYLEYPKEEIWHGGIECSAILNKMKELDIISIGGTILKYHTIEETTYVSSWVKIYHLLIKLLENL